MHPQVGNHDAQVRGEVLAEVKMELFEKNLELNHAVYEYLQDVIADWETEGAEVIALRRHVAKLQVLISESPSPYMMMMP